MYLLASLILYGFQRFHFIENNKSGIRVQVSAVSVLCMDLENTLCYFVLNPMYCGTNKNNASRGI